MISGDHSRSAAVICSIQLFVVTLKSVATSSDEYGVRAKTCRQVAVLIVDLSVILLLYITRSSTKKVAYR